MTSWGGGSLQVPQSVGSTFLDFNRLSAGISPCKEWASFVSYLAFSTLAHTYRLMLGGAIPDNKYNSSTLVGFRHPVIAWHGLLSSESSL